MGGIGITVGGPVAVVAGAASCAAGEQSEKEVPTPEPKAPHRGAILYGEKKTREGVRRAIHLIRQSGGHLTFPHLTTEA